MRTDVASRVTPCAANRDNSRFDIFHRHETLSEWKGQVHGLYMKVGI